jgi:peptide/nickel transport system substrate-binding protein
MKRLMTVNRRTFLLLTSALGASTTLRPWRALGQDQNVLHIRSYSDLQVLDPLNRLAQPEGDIMDAIFSNLVKAKPGETWDWQLDAAESIEQVDDTHIDFTLRKGIQFTGGFGELTAEDVKYSFERIADPKNESPYRDDWAVLDRVEVKEPYSGMIVLKEPFAPLWTISLVRGSGSILSKKAMESVGGKFTTEPPAGSGPYVLREWQPKQKTILARNLDFYGPAPDFDEVHIYPIEDEKTAEIAFEAGELDYTEISLSSLPELKANPPAGVKIVERPAMSYVWLGMNVDNPALGDIKVRQAIQKAVDVDAVLEAAYFGVAERSTGIIAPGLPGHRDIAPPKRDVEGAQALLEEAGASDLALSLDLLNKTEYTSAAQVIQANLAEIGITVEIKPSDSGTFWTIGDESAGDAWKDLQLILNRFSMQPDPSFATAWFTPDQIGVWNWERFNSPEFGDLHDRAIIETDPNKRHEMYVKMQDLMDASGAYVFLTHELNAAIYRDDVVPGLLPDGTVRFAEFQLAEG